MRSQERRLPLPPMDLVTVAVCTAIVFFVLAFGGKALEAYRLQRHNALLRAEVEATIHLSRQWWGEPGASTTWEGAKGSACQTREDRRNAFGDM